VKVNGFQTPASLHKTESSLANFAKLYPKQQTRGVSYIFYIKIYLKAKEELWKLKYFTVQKYNLIFERKIL
jgi:hypothetical protein